jgi:acyl phosphate:glycerol-3-phosphate acyltransferase
MSPALLIAASYLIGSIPFSYLIVRMFSGTDIREHGSRNVGATNVARTAGKLPGILALVLDTVKGYAAVALAQWLVSRPEWPLVPTADGSPWHSHEFWIAMAGLIAVLGHMFPLWLGFHGGKGVATALGVFLALDPVVVAGALLVFLIVAMVSRYVSLASIVSAASIPIFFRFLAVNAPFWHIVISAVIALAVIVKHHTNIARMAAGRERKMGERKEP